MSADDTLRQPGRVSIAPEGEARVVALVGEHDVSTVDLVREGLSKACVETGMIIIDLTRADFIDSSVAGALLEAYRRDSPPRMRFVVAPRTSPRALFTVLGFDGSVPIFDRLEDAFPSARPRRDT